MRNIAGDRDVTVIERPAARCLQARKKLRIAIGLRVIFAAGCKRAGAQRNPEDVVGTFCRKWCGGVRSFSGQRFTPGELRAHRGGGCLYEELSALQCPASWNGTDRPAAPRSVADRGIFAGLDGIERQTVARALRLETAIRFTAALPRLGGEDVGVQEVVAEFALGVVGLGQSDEVGEFLVDGLELLRGRGEKLAPVRAGVERCEFFFDDR